MRLWLLFLLLLCAPALAQGELQATTTSEGVRVDLKIDRQKIEIGQSVRADLDLHFPAKLEFKPVPVGELELKPFELQDGSGSRLPGQENEQHYRYLLRISAFEEGTLTLPALSLRFLREGKEVLVTTPTLQVEVGRVASLKSDKEGEIRDLKNPLPASFPPLLALAILVLALAALWALYRVFRWLRRPKAVPAKPALPPYQWALQELNRLSQDKPYEAGFHDDYYERLTLILRTYLGFRFDENLLEKTTSETLDRLKFQTAFGFESWRRLREILDDADLVKFAKFPPSAERCAEHLEQARALIQTYPPAQPLVEVAAS